MIEKILEKASQQTVETYQKKLLEHEVMKSLIKNIYGFYVISKLIEILTLMKLPLEQVHKVISDTILLLITEFTIKYALC